MVDSQLVSKAGCLIVNYRYHEGHVRSHVASGVRIIDAEGHRSGAAWEEYTRQHLAGGETRGRTGGHGLIVRDHTGSGGATTGDGGCHEVYGTVTVVNASGGRRTDHRLVSRRVAQHWRGSYRKGYGELSAFTFCCAYRGHGVGYRGVRAGGIREAIVE